MRNLISLLVIFTLIPFNAVAINTSARVERIDVLEGGKNVLLNPSFDQKGATKNWSLVGSASLTLESSTVVDGKQSLNLGITAAGDGVSQSVIPTQNTLNQNYEATCKVNTAMTNIQLCGLTNGQEAQCQNVPATSTFQTVSANFQGPSNGTSVGVKVKSISAGTGVVYLDDCYVGPARNLSQVSQAQFIGAVQITGCAGRWTTASTSFTDYSAQTGCSYAVSAGSSGISAPASQLPGFNLTGGAGTYDITYVGLIGQQNGTADGNPALFKLTDGTNTAIEFPGFNGSGSVMSSGGVATWHFTYTNAPTNAFIRVQGAASATSGDASIYGTSTFPGVFLVKFFPSQSQTAFSATQLPVYWAGYHSPTCNWNYSSTSFADVTNVGTPCTLTSLPYSRNIGTVSSAGGTGTSALPGISFTPPRAGRYKITSNIYAQSIKATSEYFQLIDQSSNLLGSTQYSDGGQNMVTQLQIVGYVDVTSTSSPTVVKLQSRCSTASSQCSNIATFAAAQEGISWVIEDADAPMGMPVLVGANGSYYTNFVGLTSSYQHSSATDADYNFEQGVGSWVAFSDGGTTLPVSMTGGSPTVTIAQSGTNALDGSFSGLVTKTAVNSQGQGVAAQTVYIPPGYRGSTLTLTGAFKLLTGSLVQGDVKLFAYDVTNSQVITPFNNDVVANGQFTATLPVSTTTQQIRIGFYFASTSATALTFVFDDFSLSPQGPALGMAGSDWKSYTPTFSAGLGTPTNVNMFYRQNGDSIQIKGSFNAGTTAASIGTISLPPGISIDTTKINNVAYAQSFGRGWRKSGSQTNDLTSGPNGIDWVFVYNGSTNLVQVSRQILSNGLYSSENMSTILASGEGVEIEMLTIPGATLSSNVTMAQSSTYRISSYLANGVRVTSAPVSLGQYRARYRASSSSGTLTDTAPTNAPSAANGMQIYGNVAWNAGGTSGQASVYDIYIGKNKNWRAEFYQNTGFSTPFDATYWTTINTDSGAVRGYDPNTGVLTVDAAQIESGSNTGRHLGVGIAAFTNVDSGYFDVIVSENALAVGVQAPRSEVWVTNGNGSGSTNTAIRRFSTIQRNNGTAITYVDSATNGASFTINEDGVYSITYADRNTTTASYFGPSLNSTQLTTGVASINAANIVFAVANEASGDTNGMSATIVLHAGDVIRPHGDGTQNATDVRTRFMITKVSN